MKKILLPLLAGFAIGLMLVIARRTDTDAMAVIISAAVGIVASVPTSLLLVALLRRRQRGRAAESALLPQRSDTAREVMP